jgi:hypothetical protein
MANLFKWKWGREECNLVLCAELSNYAQDVLLEKKLNKVLEQINKVKLPFKVDLVKSTVAGSTPVIEAQEMARNIIGIVVLYEPGSDLGLKTEVAHTDYSINGYNEIQGAVIRVNDLRLQQVAPGNMIYLTNLIIHEALHAFGLAHPTSPTYWDEKVQRYVPMSKNLPVMILGKTNPLGLAYDDIQGLKDKYQLKPNGTITVNIPCTGKSVLLLNIEKPTDSVQKKVTGGRVIIPYVKPGKYWLVVDGLKTKKLMLKKDLVQ